MSQQQLPPQNQQITVAEQRSRSLQVLMQKMAPQIKAALPKHMTPDRMLRIALTEFRTVKGLSECDPMSFLGAIVKCSQLGLEPGSGLGHAYLIPFRNTQLRTVECNVITGFRGLIDLARRSGRVEAIRARVVYAKDEFRFAYGDDEGIVHVPSTEEDRGEITYAYAIAKIKGCDEPQREVMTRAEIDRIARRTNNPVWKEHFAEMARKTVVRRLCKYLPQSPEMADALNLDNRSDDSQGNWDVLDAEHKPEPVKPDPERAAVVRGADDLDALQEARGEFDIAMEAAITRGVDVATIIKGDPSTFDVAKLRSAIDVLNAAKGAKQ